MIVLVDVEVEDPVTCGALVNVTAVTDLMLREVTYARVSLLFYRGASACTSSSQRT